MEVIFCYYTQALCYSVISERFTNEILISKNPKLDLYQKAQDNLLEASRICSFLANHAMLLTPFQSKKANNIPELNKNIMKGFSILFYAEAQLVAEEKANDKSLNISFNTRAGVLIDTSLLFKQCLEHFEKGINEMNPKVKEFMKSYYLDYIKGQILFCEGLAYYFSSMKYKEENPNNDEPPEIKKKRLILEAKSFKFIKKFEMEFKSKLSKNWKFFEIYINPILAKYEVEDSFNMHQWHLAVLKDVEDAPKVAPIKLNFQTEFLPKYYNALLMKGLKQQYAGPHCI